MCDPLGSEHVGNKYKLIQLRIKYIFLDHERTLASHHDHSNVKKINWFDQPFNVQYLSVIQSFHHISRIEHECHTPTRKG